jgi:hypothetical protein
MPTLTKATSNSSVQTLLAAEITTLKTQIKSGEIIRLAHINKLIYAWNLFKSHTHTVIDVYGIKEFGNNNPPGYAGPPGSFENDTTSDANGVAAGIAAESAGIIGHTKIAEILGRVSSRGAHTHTWDDRTA